jgi:hypothetical protein
MFLREVLIRGIPSGNNGTIKLLLWHNRSDDNLIAAVWCKKKTLLISQSSELLKVRPSNGTWIYHHLFHTNQEVAYPSEGLWVSPENQRFPHGQDRDSKCISYLLGRHAWTWRCSYSPSSLCTVRTFGSPQEQEASLPGTCWSSCSRQHIGSRVWTI